MSHYTPEEKVKIARDPGRPGTADFISAQIGRAHV